MNNEPIPRLSRLSAILTILQSRRLVNATQLSKKFEVSIRTIYRDIRSLEESGIPIHMEEGKGYSLMDGYSLPPIMFSDIFLRIWIRLSFPGPDHISGNHPTPRPVH